MVSRRRTWWYAAAAVAVAVTAFVAVYFTSSPTPQYGINVLWYRGQENSQQIEKDARITFAYVRNLGANSVAINFPFYMSGSTSSRVYAGSGTPTADQLRPVIQAAEHDGLSVNLRPLLDESTFGPNQFRGTIQPEDRSAWFASYTAFLKPYLVMAQSTNVSRFTVGTELTSLANDSGWINLVSGARRLFNGQLVYSNNWYQLDALPKVNTVVDQNGLDAYFPVSVGNNASVAQIAAAWNHWLDAVPSAVGVDNMVLSEVGIAAQAGAYQKPFDSGNPSEPIDATVQARWFAAACQVMHERHMGGIYFWELFLPTPPGSFNPTTAAPTSFVDRGSTAIRACFKELSRSGGHNRWADVSAGQHAHLFDGSLPTVHLLFLLTRTRAFRRKVLRAIP